MRKKQKTNTKKTHKNLSIFSLSFLRPVEFTITRTRLLLIVIEERERESIYYRAYSANYWLRFFASSFSVSLLKLWWSSSSETSRTPRLPGTTTRRERTKKIIIVSAKARGNRLDGVVVLRRRRPRRNTIITITKWCLLLWTILPRILRRQRIRRRGRSGGR